MVVQLGSWGTTHAGMAQGMVRMSGCRRLLLLLVTSVAVASSTGCTAFLGLRDFIAYNDGSNNFVIGWRNEVWARQSWHDNKYAFADQAYLADFGIGYRAGYQEVASGGNGCPPPLPPRKYWKWHYETPEGQAKIAAWFAGFPHGAAAAEQDCAGEWMEIPVARHVDLQYSPEFQDGTMFMPPEALDEYQSLPEPQYPSGNRFSPGVLAPGDLPPAGPSLMHETRVPLPQNNPVRTATISMDAASDVLHRSAYRTLEQGLNRPTPPPEGRVYPNT